MVVPLCKTLLVLLYLNLASPTVTIDWCVNHIMSLIEDNKKCLYYFDKVDDKVVKINNISCSILTITEVEEEKYDGLSSIVMMGIPLKRDTFWASTFDRLIRRGVVVVVILKDDVNLSNVFEEFWHYRIANVVLIDRTLRVYTYRPVSQGDPSKPVFLGRCENVSKYARESDTRHFGNATLAVYTDQNRPFTDFGSGLEDKMLQIMAKHLQFNANVKSELEELTSTIFSYGYDLAMAGLVLELLEDTYTEEDLLYYQVQNEIAYLIPFAKPVQPWRNALDIFDLSTWTCTIFATAALVFVGYLAHIEDTLFYVISILFLNTCHCPSRLKLLYLLWNIFALIMTSVYSGLLVSFMCKTRLEGQPSTLDELVEVGYQLGAGFLDMDPKLRSLPGVVLCSQDASECYDRLVQGGFAYFCNTHKMKFWLNDYKIHEWYKLPSEKRSYMAYTALKRSPFSQSVHEYLQFQAEFGIIAKLDEYEWKMTKGGKESGFRIVTLYHLSFVFVVHMAGVLCAGVVFIVERLYKEIVCTW